MIVMAQDALDRHRFAPAKLDALFAAILVDDDVDAEVALPQRITLDHDPMLLVDCFGLSRQLWIERADQTELRRLLARIRREGGLDSADQSVFKHIRAKLKHLRFAHALYSDTHRYPPVTNLLTVALGRLQDASRNGQSGQVQLQTRVASFLLKSLPSAWLRHEHDQLAPTTSAGFRDFAARDMHRLAHLAAANTATGASFHAARKAASRQVSFYDTARTLRPSAEFTAMSRFLAAINGLMGSFHDQLVSRRAAGTQDYRRKTFPLPTDTKQRISELVGAINEANLELRR